MNAALQSLLGLVIMIALVWLASENRRAVHWRPVWSGLLLALLMTALMRWLPGVQSLLAQANSVLDALETATRAGSSFVFGHLGGGPAPYAVTDPGRGFILATQVLPMVLLVGALSALLFHWGILTRLVLLFAWLLRRTLGLGGVVGVSAAANAFVGMVEGPLVVRPWLARLSRGELFMIMNCGMATTSGSIVALYATMIRPVVPDAIGHLLAASVIAVPVSLAVAALWIPVPPAREDPTLVFQREDDNAVAAIARGTLEALQLVLNIVAMLIVFVGLVALVNLGLGALPAPGGMVLSVEGLLGLVFAPLAWLVGVPWEEARVAGELLGKKTVLNEFIAYLDLAGPAGAQLGEHSRLLMAYALSGFANFGSVGIMLGGLGALLPPERRGELTSLALKSLPAGMLSSCITAALVGVIASIAR
ncbi:MAG: NupC/NupG family nucleoside CNT transporter [Burkholderiales bacterium]|jgi:CNT family concentrative nucleoside transporter